MKKKDAELNPALEFGAARNRHTSHKTSAKKGKKISNIMKGSLLAATVGVTVVVVSTLGVSCKPKTIGASTASFSVVVSDSAENIADGGFGGVDYVLEQMPSAKPVASGVITDVNNVLDFSGLKPATTYLLSFTVPDEESEGGVRLVESCVFTTLALKGGSGTAGGDPFGGDVVVPDDPPEELPDPGLPVPDVTGMTLEQATAALAEAGFANVSSVITEDYNDAPAGTVVAQSHTGAAYADQAIILTLSKGPRVYVGASPVSLFCDMGVTDNVLQYRAVWAKNDAEDVSMRVTINGVTIKSYSAAQTAALLYNGEYVFEVEYVDMGVRVGDYEEDYYTLGRDLTVSFTLSYKLNGQAKTSVQTRNYRYGGVSLVSFSYEVLGFTETEMTVKYEGVLSLVRDAHGYTELGNYRGTVPSVEITDGTDYLHIAEMAGGTPEPDIRTSDDGTQVSFTAFLVHDRAPDGHHTGYLIVPARYVRDDGAIEEYERTFRFRFDFTMYTSG